MDKLGITVEHRKEQLRSRTPGQRGRPVGVKTGMGQYGQGHRILRGTQALALVQQIKALHDGGQTIREIAVALRIAKGVAFTSLFGKSARRHITQLVEEATIDCMIGFGELMETLRSEMVQNKVRSALGTLQWTPEQLGTAVRAAEKYMGLLKEVSGRGLKEFRDTVQETKKDPRLLQAQQTLQKMREEGETPASRVEDAEVG